MATKQDLIKNNENEYVEIINKKGVEMGVERILMQNMALLPKTIATERIISAAGFYIANRQDKNGNYELMALDKSSKLQMLYGVLKEAMLGLEAGTDYDILLFKGKPTVCRKKDAWFKVIDLIKPAEIIKFVVNVATIGDKISFNPVTETVNHIPKDNRGQSYKDIIAAYAYVKFANGFEKAVFLDKSDIEHIRNLSPSAKNGAYSVAWDNHSIKMVKTKAAKELAKELYTLYGGRLNNVLQQAVMNDETPISRINNDGFIIPDNAPVYEPEPEPERIVDVDTGEIYEEEINMDDLPI